ncbi:hypothetical protein [Streptomyces sp. NPDC014676]|uniref:hypothetical protein n=1 Tax=Streptomyces sp. NPDC014676 TaxID=3364879 RepID=UPI0036F5A029
MMPRADAGELIRDVAGSKILRGAKTVAEAAVMFARSSAAGRTALANDSLGLLGVVDGRIRSVMSVTIADHRITAMDILAGPDRLVHSR